ncbi:MAG: hypothetical protein WCR67_03275 [Bacilli bacterium]
METIKPLYTENYAQRAIIRRIFVERIQITNEKIMLLSEVMNYAQQATLKKPLESYAGARVSFSSYYYGGGFIFEGKLTQSEPEGLSYFLSDPYKKAEEIFDEIYLTGFPMNEKVLAICKDRLLQKYNKLQADSFASVLSELQVNYSFPELNVNLVRSMTLDDLAVGLKIVRSSLKGQYVFIGKKRKKEIIHQEYEKTLSSLPFDFDVASKDVFSSSFQNECATYILSINEVKGLKDVSMLFVAFNAFSQALKEKIKKNYNLDVELKVFIISPIKAGITIMVEKGRLLMVEKYLDNLFSLSPSAIDDYISKSIQDEKLLSVRLASDFDMAIMRMKLIADFALPYSEEEFFNVEEITKEEVKKTVSTVKKIFAIKGSFDKGETK